MTTSPENTARRGPGRPANAPVMPVALAVAPPVVPQEAAAPDMIPVEILRGYWPSGPVGDVALPSNRPKLEAGTLCMLGEDEVQYTIDIGVARILTPKGYREAKEAAAIKPEPQQRLVKFVRA